MGIEKGEIVTREIIETAICIKVKFIIAVLVAVLGAIIFRYW